MPVLFLSHGGGPLWFMDGSDSSATIAKLADKNSKSAEFMRQIRTIAQLPRHPKAILVISAHWEEKEHTVLAAANHKLYFDYRGFPDHTYQLEYPVPGAPDLAKRTRELLIEHGITCLEETKRGLDHGVFIPLKMAYPEADVPVFEVSLKDRLSVEDHAKLGEALQPLAKEDILIIGSGFTTHCFDRVNNWCEPFRTWFNDVYTNPAYTPDERKTRILASDQEPTFYQAHPTIEHYVPVVVACAAAGYCGGRIVYEELMAGNVASTIRFA